VDQYVVRVREGPQCFVAPFNVVVLAVAITAGLTACGSSGSAGAGRRFRLADQQPARPVHTSTENIHTLLVRRVID
jgi:hypothetical protein